MSAEHRQRRVPVTAIAVWTFAIMEAAAILLVICFR